MPYHQKLHIILVEDSALFRSVSKKQEDSTGSYLKAKVKGLPVKMSDTGQKRPGAYKLKLILVANGSMGEENPWFVHPSILGITTRNSRRTMSVDDHVLDLECDGNNLKAERWERNGKSICFDVNEVFKDDFTTLDLEPLKLKIRTPLQTGTDRAKHEKKPNNDEVNVLTMIQQKLKEGSFLPHGNGAGASEANAEELAQLFRRKPPAHVVRLHIKLFDSNNCELGQETSGRIRDSGSTFTKEFKVNKFTAKVMCQRGNIDLTAIFTKEVTGDDIEAEIVDEHNISLFSKMKVTCVGGKAAIVSVPSLPSEDSKGLRANRKYSIRVRRVSTDCRSECPIWVQGHFAIQDYKCLCEASPPPLDHAQRESVAVLDGTGVVNADSPSSNVSSVTRSVGENDSIMDSGTYSPEENWVPLPTQERPLNSSFVDCAQSQPFNVNMVLSSPANQETTATPRCITLKRPHLGQNVMFESCGTFASDHTGGGHEGRDFDYSDVSFPSQAEPGSMPTDAAPTSPFLYDFDIPGLESHAASGHSDAATSQNETDAIGSIPDCTRESCSKRRKIREESMALVTPHYDGGFAAGENGMVVGGEAGCQSTSDDSNVDTVMSLATLIQEFLKQNASSQNQSQYSSGGPFVSIDSARPMKVRKDAPVSCTARVTRKLRAENAQDDKGWEVINAADCKNPDQADDGEQLIEKMSIMTIRSDVGRELANAAGSMSQGPAQIFDHPIYIGVISFIFAVVLLLLSAGSRIILEW